MRSFWMPAVMAILGLLLWHSVSRAAHYRHYGHGGGTDNWDDASITMHPIESNSFEWSKARSIAIGIRGDAAANVTVRQAAAADANATAVFSYTLQYSEDTPIAASKIETSFEDGKAMLSIETATLPSHRGRYVKFKLTGDLVVPIGFYQPPSIAGLDLDVNVRFGSIVVQPVASESQPEPVVFGSLNIATGAGVAKVAVGGHLAAKTVSIKTNAGTVSAGNLLVDESVAIKTRAGNVDASEVSVHGGSVNLATDAGNVHATVKGYASLVATTGAGSIDLAVEPAQGSATNAESGAGNVKLSVAPGYKGTFKAKSSVGTVNVKVNGSAATLDSNSSTSSNWWGWLPGSEKSGRVGDGQDGGHPSTIDAKTGSGNVALAFN
ncbi:hypothetical protein BC831DRAFT_436982 [Entophlyctis helioformis]|nr:hypothetical protein BC831DRAFT_436982 [Entophlyctis helioformis]